MTTEIDIRQVPNDIQIKLENTLPIVQKQIDELIVSKNADTTIADLQYSGQTPLVWLQQCAMQQQNCTNANNAITPCSG